MKLDKLLKFHIEDINCEFRTIHELDVSQSYVDGLKEQTKYIENIPADVSLTSQMKYVEG